MNGHDSRGPEISQPETRWHREKRHVEAEDPSGWPLAGRGLIQAWRKRRRRRFNHILHCIFFKIHFTESKYLVSNWSYTVWL